MKIKVFASSIFSFILTHTNMHAHSCFALQQCVTASSENTFVSKFRASAQFFTMLLGTCFKRETSPSRAGSKSLPTAKGLPISSKWLSWLEPIVKKLSLPLRDDKTAQSAPSSAFSQLTTQSCFNSSGCTDFAAPPLYRKAPFRPSLPTLLPRVLFL